MLQILDYPWSGAPMFYRQYPGAGPNSDPSTTHEGAFGGDYEVLDQIHKRRVDGNWDLAHGKVGRSVEVPGRFEPRERVQHDLRHTVTRGSVPILR